MGDGDVVTQALKTDLSITVDHSVNPQKFKILEASWFKVSLMIEEQKEEAPVTVEPQKEVPIIEEQKAEAPAIIEE